MNVLVTYMSITGNTKKIAEAIYDEIKEEKEIKTWDDIDNLDGFNLTFVGFPIPKFGPDEKEKAFLVKHTLGKNIVMFVTHATPPNAPFLSQQLEMCKKAVSGANLVGFFNCQGELSEECATMLKQADNPQLQKFGEMRYTTLGHPTADEVEKAREFARDIMEKQS